MISHDGLRDSFTNLASIQLLHEELRRELARVARRDEVISLVRFVLVSPTNSESPSFIAQLDREILHFGRTLTLFTRTEDTCARMGEREFLCSMNTKEFQVSEWLERIHSRWHSAVVAEYGRAGSRQVEEAMEGQRDHLISMLKYSSIQSEKNETVLMMLNRLDLEELIVVQAV